MVSKMARCEPSMAARPSNCPPKIWMKAASSANCAAKRRLSEAFAVAAGVPAVAEATERAYRHRAAGALGWPVAKWLRRLRPDPLRRLHLDRQTTTAVRDAGVQLVGLNFLAGNMPEGDRGLVSWPARSSEFRDNVDVTVTPGKRPKARQQLPQAVPQR